MVTLLAFNVKIEKPILKYFIAEESFNAIVLDGNISWCRYLFWRSWSAAAIWAIWHCDNPSP